MSNKSFVWVVPATVERVIDGDSVRVVLDLGWRMSHRSSVRLHQANVERLGTSAGDAARLFVETLLPPGTAVTVESARLDGFGRTLGDILLEHGRSLTQALIDAGHATWRRR